MSEIYTIGGGKGGIGKSFIAANLGALIAKKGKKVLLVDLDLGGSNLHTYLGLGPLKTGIHEFINKTVTSLDQVIIPTELRNLFFINSVNCSIEIANLYAVQKLKIIRAIQTLPFDYIIIDLGAGTNYNILDFYLTSNQGIMICTCEPTSIENAFKFLKAVYLRIVKKILKQDGFQGVVKYLDFSNDSVNESFQIIRRVKSLDKDKGIMTYFDELNYYELLEIDMDASVFEIRKAYKEQLEIYDTDSISTYTLFPEEQRDNILNRLEAAFLTLLDEKKRAVYDNQLVVTGWIDSTLLTEKKENKPLPIFQEVKAMVKNHVANKINQKLQETDIKRMIEKFNLQYSISGRDIQQLRIAIGIELVDIFEISRISVSNLNAIEENRARDFPSKIFLKGFLKSYAELFGLDPEKLIKSYPA